MDPSISVAGADDVLRRSPFGPWWGFETIAVQTGTATLRFPARPHHYRPNGVLQGGCCMALADVTFWIALMTVHGTDDPAVTLEMKTNFLAGATGNLTCTARLVSNGNTVAFGTAETADSGNRIVAHHTLTYLRRSQRLIPGPGASAIATASLSPCWPPKLKEPPDEDDEDDQGTQALLAVVAADLAYRARPSAELADQGQVEGPG